MNLKKNKTIYSTYNKFVFFNKKTTEIPSFFFFEFTKSKKYVFNFYTCTIGTAIGVLKQYLYFS